MVIIDGGAGHLKAASDVFADLGISNIRLAAIAKGPNRNAGEEVFYTTTRPKFSLERNDPTLYFMQRLRDEAHRYAITNHRAKRSRKIYQSVLDEIPGIGSKRKRALLHHFGSSRAVERAGIADLETVQGISFRMAQDIYNFFRS